LFVLILVHQRPSKNKKRKTAIVEYLDYQIPITQLKGPNGNGNMKVAKRNWNALPTRDLNIWLW